jgi:hypothetical protein
MNQDDPMSSIQSALQGICVKFYEQDMETQQKMDAQYS